ncbi:peptidylprolyl isomerase [Fontisphaera persica]|uniref:peptidylprolyl isomerase n=1 Tax=Fontisphaera persica TaxID=2974023 RepID=UPI0024BF7104|nr:peptidylprolyl isomerase [Fontisphaera persica]WCJ58455.1 peptidylprolyl isomerase [Fontisphaera persica]
MKKLIPFTAVCATLVLAVAAGAADQPAAAAAPKPAAKELFPDSVVAKGKGVEVKRSQVDEAYSLFKANVAASGRAVREEDRNRDQAMLLDRIISTKLLVARATEEDKKKAAENADKYIAETKKRLPSEEFFELQLKSIGLTPATYRERLLEQAICEEVINREVRDKNQVTEAEIKKFYDENPKEFEQPEQVRAAHVLISFKDPTDPNPNPGAKRDLPAAQKEEKKKLAESILARAKKGEDFAKLAKEFSDDPGSKDKGGEYTFARGRMVPEFEAAAFATPPGQVSDLVTTVFGYHVIKVLEKIPAQKVELAKVADDIKRYLANEKVQEEMPKYLQKIREEAKVEILDPNLKVQTPAAPRPPAASAPKK